MPERARVFVLAAIGLLAMIGSPRSGDAAPLQGTWEFALDGNPSTGYRWMLDEAASDEAGFLAVTLVGYKPVSTGRLGAPAPFVIRMQCKAEGEARLVFVYVGPTGTLSDERHETWVRCG